MPHHDDDKISLPRQFARTRRFTLGAPSAFTVSADGSSVLFLRSRAGDDPATCLWAMDAASGEERLLADPAALTGGDAHGIGSYATDDATTLAVFTLAGTLWAVDVATGAARPLPVPAGARDPRPDPSGRLVAYLSGGALRVIGADGADDRAVAEPDGPDVRFGVAEYAASASMGRTRGYWWSPDGACLLTTRVDESRVALWHVGHPSEPARPPRAVRYPAAGTANADVTLWIARPDGGRVEVDWDRTAFEYVTAAGWDAHGPYLAVQSRDQRTVRVLAADPDSGRTRLLAEQHDPRWVRLVPGTPARTGSGRLVAHADLDGTRRLTVDGVPVTPPGLQLEAVLGVDGDDVLFTASDDPVQTHLWLHSPATGIRRLSVTPGVHGGTRRAGTLVHVTRTAEHPGERTRVERRAPSGPEAARARPAGVEAAALAARAGVEVASVAQRPVLGLRRLSLVTTERRLRSHLHLPSWHRPGDPALPVLLDPYAGPAARRVTDEQAPMMFVSQWFAEQGFAVLVTDGAGTPGRGPDWEREVHGDMFGPVLEDQVAALHAVAARHTELDLRRVAMRGWSFAGTLAVMAVLRRPDVFHAAVAGAGVSDQRLYDTHWRERFLGHPGRHPERYDACSTLVEAHTLARPLQLIHGLSDDNVFPAGTLLLSSALLAAGRPHEVLPLSGASHAPTSDEDVFEGMLLLQLDFLHRHLTP
ncbi:prolyl oligopeptidase family serine peptidase [Nonomuraea sp. NPDC052265]|uniref:S9 family peptidase n=1 Tax=Nonomuraea sp. NPDC052265 TaxID=3364374 RepID=UPI0037C80109